MSDYEKINTMVKANLNKTRQEAIKRIVKMLLKLLLAVCVIAGLKAITFISGTFAVILMAVAVCVGAFQIGYIWRDIKF